MTIRVFVLDDQDVVRAGLRSVLERSGDVEVVGEASTGSETLRQIPELLPDVAILDVRLEGESGIEVCRELRSEFPDMACLMFTGYESDEAFYASVLAGATGFLNKQVQAAELVESVQIVAAGKSLLDPVEMQLLVRRLESEHAKNQRVSILTPQEHRVLHLIGTGLSNRQIAASMDLAEKTVKNYVSTLLAKLGVTNRTQAAVQARRFEGEH